MATKKKYTKAELNKFRKIILEKMDAAVKDTESIKESMGNNFSSDAGLSPDSVYSVHMADAGTDSHEREKSYLFMARENTYYRNLEVALERIDRGEFGVCVLCEELIPMERMEEVPNATKCVGCKTKEKLNLI